MMMVTAGHVDHGKTALIQALTGVDTDRLPEEKKRGMTIDLGYAFMNISHDIRLAFVDVPGHEKFINNMLVGVANAKHALVVIAADDGVMPQTREHLAILKLLNLTSITVVISKCDKAESGQIERVIQQMTPLLTEFDCQQYCFSVSAKTGQGIEQLKQHLCQLALRHLAKQNEIKQSFRMALDRVFTVKGAGVVVTGTVISGQVNLDDKLYCSNQTDPVRVRSIHAQGQTSTQGGEQQRVALNLTGFDHHHLPQRGDWLTAQQQPEKTDRITAIFSGKTTPNHWQSVHLHHGGVHCLGRIAYLAPTATAQQHLIELQFDKPLLLTHLDHIIVRDAIGQSTLGAARVLELTPPNRGKRKPERLSYLQQLSQCDQPIDALMVSCQQQPQIKQQISWHWQVSTDYVTELAQALQLQQVDQYLLASSSFEQIQTKLYQTLNAYHQSHSDELGLGRSRLARMSHLTVADKVIFHALNELCQQNKLQTSRGLYHLPQHQLNLNPQEQKVWLQMQSLLAQSNQPLWVTDFAKTLKLESQALRSLCYKLVQMGHITAVVKDRYLLTEQLHQYANQIRQHLNDHQQLETSDFRQLINMGRKVSIQVLELFDKTGFTRREYRGNSRIIRDNELFQFEPQAVPSATSNRSLSSH